MSDETDTSDPAFLERLRAAADLLEAVEHNRGLLAAIPEADRIDLMAIYSKGEKEDLTAAEKKALRGLADEARAEASRRVRRKEH